MAEDWLEQIDWNRQGVVPALAQDAENGRLLIQAWVNRQALVLSVARGQAVFCAADGAPGLQVQADAVLRIVEIRSDAARGAVLFQVRQETSAVVPGFASRLLEGRWQAETDSLHAELA